MQYIDVINLLLMQYIDVINLLLKLYIDVINLLLMQYIDVIILIFNLIDVEFSIEVWILKILLDYK